MKKYGVTSFLESENEILILLRSEHVSTYPGKWGGISGSLDKDKTADEQAIVEIEEETSLCGKDIKLIKKGVPLMVEDENLGVRWVVHPYLFHIEDRSKIKIDWEHKETKWINPKDIGIYHIVPMLKETLAQVYK